MRNELDVKKRDDIVGDDVVITLPFKCEEEMVEWESKDTQIRIRRSGKRCWVNKSIIFLV